MAHVVAEPCLDCRHAVCVAVCPTNCFCDGRRMLYIHPADCIDCTACVAACPTGAIYHEDRLPVDWIPYRDLNATMARQCARIIPKRSWSARLPAITGSAGASDRVLAASVGKGGPSAESPP